MENKFCDECLACHLIKSSEQLAETYLAAVLQSTTPELSSLLSTHLTQVISENMALKEMAIRNKWLEIYHTDAFQLKIAYDKIKALIGQTK